MEQMLSTPFTARFGLRVPIAGAPMAGVSGGALATAVSQAGGLGFVGGGYGEEAWTRRELGTAERGTVGCGFVTWAIENDDRAFEAALEMGPRAIFLSFGDPHRFARRALDRNIPVFCQVQLLEQVQQAIDAGASVIVAQGTEAGGHGMSRRTVMSLVPEIRDWLDARAPGTLLLAAGGIADGRGLAAALMLGADGVVVGTRLWASRESLAPERAKTVAQDLDGDSTCRSQVFDILRRKNWPREYDFRAYRNAIHERLEGDVEALRRSPDAARAEFEEAMARGDYSIAHLTVGESIGPGADFSWRAVARNRAAAST
jgi:nitronate monooxygenase